MIKYFCASNDPDQLVQNIIYNPVVNRHEIVIEYDHNREKGLPERYNEFIDRNLNSDCWLVFIHDDVQLLEDIAPKLEGIPKDIIYGACGAKKTNGKGEIVGQILAQDSRVNNGQKFALGRMVDGYEIVPTFDPLTIIIHSEIAHGVTFDENLGYHLFSEEVSIDSKINWGRNSAVLQIDLCHYSWGTKTPEYYTALEYIKKKHNLQRFIGTCEANCMDDQEEDAWN
jgi:hypothetical protein